MKKLYYLDESEKERILHLHESHTKKQYLMNEQFDQVLIGESASVGPEDVERFYKETNPNRTPFNDKLRDLCKKSGNPTLSEGELSQKFNYYWTNFSKRNRGNWFSGSALSRIKDVIRELKTINNFCAINKKYIDAGGYSDTYPGGDLIYGMSKFVYADEAWKTNIETPLQELIDAQGDVTAQGQNDTLESVTKEIKTYCDTAKGGTVNDVAYKWFTFATSGYGLMSTDTYNNVLSSIKSLSSLDFCSTYTKYKDEVKKNLIDSFLARIFLPNYKQEIINLIKSRIKGSPKTATGVTAGGGGGGGAYYQVAGGYVFNSAMTPEALQAIRTKIGSKDTAKTLTQNDINLIYQTLG